MPDTRREPTTATSGLLYTKWHQPQDSKPSALAKPTLVDSYSNGEHLRPRRKAQPTQLHRDGSMGIQCRQKKAASQSFATRTLKGY